MVQLSAIAAIDLVVLVCQVFGHPLMKTVTRLREAYFVKISHDVCFLIGPGIASVWMAPGGENLGSGGVRFPS
jgi:hypothetical protein